MQIKYFIVEAESTTLTTNTFSQVPFSAFIFAIFRFMKHCMLIIRWYLLLFISIELHRNHLNKFRDSLPSDLITSSKL